MGALLERIHRAITTKPQLVLLVALLSAAPMGYFSVQLFGDLRADLKELLPENARSVKTLVELERRFGGFSELAVLIRSPDPAANRRFSDDLVAAVKGSALVRSVRNKLGPEKAFFEEHRHVFVPRNDLELMLERIEDAANDARARANPLLVDLEDKAPVKLDFSDLEKKYADKLAAASRFPDDYFEAKDKQSLAVIIRKKGLAFGIGENMATVELVQKAVDGLEPHKYHPEMKVQLGGDVKNMVEEHDSLLADILTATLITIALLALVVFAYYRSFRAFVITAVPLTVGLAWTFGLGHFVVGYVNASSAFLGPIVAGNGINFGLILLARYIEDRRSGLGVDEAIRSSVALTVRGTSGAAIAAGISYFSLILTDNRGFQHFGIIAGIGMVVCWISTFTVLPALLTLWEHRWPHAYEAPKTGPLAPGAFARLPFALMASAPRGFAIGGILLGLVCSYFTVQFMRDPFEKDFSKLRSTYARDEGATPVAAKVDDIFGRYSAPQVILADTDEDVPQIVNYLEEKIRSGGENYPISSVLSLDMLVPKDQPGRIEVLKKIRATLNDELLENLDEKQREQAKSYRPPEHLEPYSVTDLPETLRADFREKDGTEGRVVLVFPNYKLNLYNADEIHRVAEVMRSIPLKSGKRVEASGAFVIYDDMLRSVSEDGPQATLVSLLGVLFLCFLLFRGLHFIPVGGSLLIGVTALCAIMLHIDLKVNFLNFIAFPITFGIGVDYAVNVYARYLLERPGAGRPEPAVERAVIGTGGAVMLCSMTTIIGYGSLLVAHNGSLVSFGKAAILGELTCVTSAVLLMPAWIYAWARRPK